MMAFNFGLLSFFGDLAGFLFIRGFFFDRAFYNFYDAGNILTGGQLVFVLETIPAVGFVQGAGAALFSAFMAHELVTILSRSNTLNDVDMGTFVRWVVKCLIGLFFFDNAVPIATALAQLSVPGVGALTVFQTIVDNAITIAAAVGGLVVLYGAILLSMAISANDAQGFNKGALTIAGGAMFTGILTVFYQFIPAVGGDAAGDADSFGIDHPFQAMLDQMDDFDTGTIILLWMVSFFALVFAIVIPVLLQIVVSVLGIEIAIMAAFAPIPMSSMVSEEFSDLAKGYMKRCIALGLRYGVIVTVMMFAPSFLNTLVLAGTGFGGGFVGALAMIIFTIGALAGLMKLIFSSKDIANAIVGV